MLLKQFRHIYYSISVVICCMLSNAHYKKPEWQFGFRTYMSFRLDTSSHFLKEICHEIINFIFKKEMILCLSRTAELVRIVPGFFKLPLLYDFLYAK